jgi:hypothetical protein
VDDLRCSCCATAFALHSAAAAAAAAGFAAAAACFASAAACDAVGPTGVAVPDVCSTAAGASCCSGTATASDTVLSAPLPAAACCGACSAAAADSSAAVAPTKTADADRSGAGRLPAPDESAVATGTRAGSPACRPDLRGRARRFAAWQGSSGCCGAAAAATGPVAPAAQGAAGAAGTAGAAAGLLLLRCRLRLRPDMGAAAAVLVSVIPAGNETDAVTGGEVPPGPRALAAERVTRRISPCSATGVSCPAAACCCAAPPGVSTER